MVLERVFQAFLSRKQGFSPRTKITVFGRPLRGAIHPPPREMVSPNAAGAKIISFKSFSFTRGPRSPKGNSQILLVLELEGIKDSRDAEMPKVCTRKKKI